MRVLLPSLLVALSFFTVSAAEEAKHLFILSGQSNMAGLNPQTSFIPAVEKALGQDRVIVIKDAQGGQPIRRWDKQWKPAATQAAPKPFQAGDLYDRLMTKVKPAVEGTPLASVTFVWMQGERDAKEQYGSVYAASLQRVINQVAADLDYPKVHFVIGRLSDFDMKNQRYKDWVLVREQQVQLAESSPVGAWVDTDDLNNKPAKQGGHRDDLHYTREGYKLLGQRFADAALALLRAPQTP